MLTHTTNRPRLLERAPSLEDAPVAARVAAWALEAELSPLRRQRSMLIAVDAATWRRIRPYLHGSGGATWYYHVSTTWRLCRYASTRWRLQVGSPPVDAPPLPARIERTARAVKLDAAPPRLAREQRVPRARLVLWDATATEIPPHDAVFAIAWAKRRGHRARGRGNEPRAMVFAVRYEGE